MWPLVAMCEVCMVTTLYPIHARNWNGVGSLVGRWPTLLRTSHFSIVCTVTHSEQFDHVLSPPPPPPGHSFTNWSALTNKNKLIIVLWDLFKPRCYTLITCVSAKNSLEQSRWEVGSGSAREELRSFYGTVKSITVPPLDPTLSLLNPVQTLFKFGLTQRLSTFQDLGPPLSTSGPTVYKWQCIETSWQFI
jgi:hypothetical protein